MAREVDPEGTRMIGVLTKVDLMDTGTDVVDILAGRVIPLRLGYVPIVNRGQRDIDTSKPIHSRLTSPLCLAARECKHRSSMYAKPPPPPRSPSAAPSSPSSRR